MSKVRILLIFIFFISLGLRLVLSIINRQANDDHMEVINWIVDKHEIPGKKDCWECFQPKLFYVMHAGIIKALHIDKKEQRIFCVQLVNFVFSFFLLFFLWKFIERQNFSPQIKLLSFALFALNPCLLGINVQATNDTLEILVGVLTIYFADLFFTFKNWRHGAWMICFAILAPIVKGSGLVILLSLLAVFWIKLIGPLTKERKQIRRMFFFCLLFCFTVVPFAGGYYQNLLKYNSPFASNQRQKDPPPSFFQRTYVERPGITSVIDGYFTFRYLDMIRQPYITNGDEDYPLHRTSLWSQLYGRTFFLHFDQWPITWQSTEPMIVFIGRLLIITGIFPLLLFLSGLIKKIFQQVRHFRKDKFNYFILNNVWIYFLLMATAILFIIQYTYDYRDFSTMKSIFIFPALPAFIIFYLEGFSMIKSRRLINLLFIVHGIIITLSICDVGFLIHQLY